MEDLIVIQNQIKLDMEKLYSNFKKAGSDRKTPSFLKEKLEILNKQWHYFQDNHATLCESDNRDHTYFVENFFQNTLDYYQEVKSFIEKYLRESKTEKLKIGPPTSNVKYLENKNDMTELSSMASTSATFLNIKPNDQSNTSKLEEMLRKQRSNFKAFSRTTNQIDISDLTEKWELEDALKTIQSRWQIIDLLHWDIDSEMNQEDIEYEQTFTKYELIYINLKKEINSKMWAASNKERSAPQMDIPTFNGSYTNWICFKDLFTECIHNNRAIPNAQKMQFLKNKVRGEAEKLIQHLSISSENYLTCWEILNHRYNNTKLLFSSHISVLLSLPAMQNQSATSIKKIHDTTNECLNAIKNLGVDITNWDPLIVHILAQKLDSETHHNYIESLENPRDLPTLHDFLSFLEVKFTSLESSRRKQESTNQQRFTPLETYKKPSYQKPSDENKYYQSKPFINHTSTTNKPTNQCPLCNNIHKIFFCKQFRNTRPGEKKAIVTKFNLCKNCLINHKGEKCLSNKTCYQCNEKHNTLLHDAYVVTMNTTGNTSEPEPSYGNHITQTNSSEILLSTALVNVLADDGSRITLRALIDQGSQTSLITENAAQMLRLPRKNCKGVIFGVGTTENTCKGIQTIQVSAIYHNYSFETDVFIMKKLINKLPNQSFEKPTWPLLQTIDLADPDFNVSRPIDLLFGADIYSSIMLGGIIRQNENQPIVQQTRLGWILCGSMMKSYHCNVVLNNIDQIQQFWTIEDVEENSNLSSENQKCIDQYQAETYRKKDGRYVVRLPLVPNVDDQLGESKTKAVAQFHQLERKFSKNPELYTKYASFIQEYIDLNHMSVEYERDNKPRYYLPHHSVIRADSTTTALRVVFNASANTSSGRSINDLMYCGPNIQQSLFTLTFKWRQFAVGFTADLEKMFRQVLVHNDDQRYQMIVWRNKPSEPLQDYKLLTVTYGTKAAPFLAMMTLKRLAEDERGNLPNAAKVLEEKFYMDDLVHGEHTIEAAVVLKNQLIELLKTGGFNLRKWASNKPELLNDIKQNTPDQCSFDFKHTTSHKTLGLRWNPAEDTFTFELQISRTKGKTTKRILLSQLSKIFDPLGWLTPITACLKILFQRVWLIKDLQWDDEVPSNVLEDWNEIKEELPLINQITIPRWIGSKINETIELHGFCDASTKAYACVIYCKITKTSKITIATAKCRLAPTNKIVSVPRLELSAAYLLAKLMKVVIECLPDHNLQIFGWSDSTAVLGWLRGEPNRWKPFVTNRVQYITETMAPECWHYVKSSENPADCASRGLSTVQLRDFKLWWHGPQWLTDYKHQNHNKCPSYTTTEEIKITRQVNVISIPLNEENMITRILANLSNLPKIFRIVAWLLRFCNNIQKKNVKEQKPNLTIPEIRRAKTIIIKQIQATEFSQEIHDLENKGSVSSKSKILNLNPFLDEHGQLRVGGRLKNANINHNMQHPLIIPQRGRLTVLLINQGHQATYHGGPRLTMGWLRTQYWIIGGNNTTKRLLRGCVVCRKHNPVKRNQLMADLPKMRTNPTRPFYHTGVDFMGYVDVKYNKGRGVKTTKGYISVFVCMVTKAIHLELVSDLSSPAFLAALRRMVARRGAPHHIYSDNGTNFVGANKAPNQEFINLKTTLNGEFYSAITEMEITWHFNAPLWPSAGGLWEAAVKSLKFHLKRVIGTQKLTYEEYSTLLCQLEACLNSRPLCAISEDPQELNYITPAHFLACGPTLTIVETEKNQRSRWRLTQKIYQDVWKKWKSDYLTTITTRAKWHKPSPNIKINDIVMIQDTNLPAGKWGLGRIHELHHGKDGLLRVVSIKDGILKRPIVKLSPLPVNDEPENTTP